MICVCLCMHACIAGLSLAFMNFLSLSSTLKLAIKGYKI